jgi:hypothetical protein
MAPVRVVATDEARSYVGAHGGVLYVNARRHHCCSGSFTILESSTSEPADLVQYRSFDSDGFTLYLRTAGRREPDELVIEMRGLARKRPAAFWNGCALT